MTVLMTSRPVAKIDITFDSSRRNSAPRMHCMPLSFLVTMKFVQNFVGCFCLFRSWNVKWLVPVIILLEVPVAVAIFMDVGFMGKSSLLTTDWWSKLFEAPVSTRHGMASLALGKIAITKNSFFPTIALYNFAFLESSFDFDFMNAIVLSIY